MRRLLLFLRTRVKAIVAFCYAVMGVDFVLMANHADSSTTRVGFFIAAFGFFVAATGFAYDQWKHRTQC